MANNITNASLSDIRERISNAPAYHPMDAETFSDWSMEAGDVVTVSRDGTEYHSPVHTQKMVWKGAPQTTISSTGNKEREALSKMSRKKYGSGGAAVRANEGIHSYVWNTTSTMYSYIDQTASYIVQGVESVESRLGSEILQTAEEIRSEVHAADSQLYSYVDQTATYISSHVEDVANDLGSEILQTASQIRSEVHAANSQVYSYVDQTATYISSHVEDVANDLGSEILQTASQIRSEVHAANSQVYSYVDQTATYISSHVEDVANDLGSEILQTASQIRSEVHAADSQLYSYVDQTATYISSHIEDVANDIGSEILQTASQIRSEVHAADSQLYSYVDQTATYIQSVIEDTANDLGSSILQTACQIRSDVYASNSEIYSYVNQTASGIEQVVANTARGLTSRIDQQDDKISLVVDGNGDIKAAEIAASINDQTGQSMVKLSADVIDIDGDTIVDWLEGEDVVCAELETGSLTCGGTLTLDVDAPIIGDGGGTSGDIGGLVIGVEKDDATGIITLTQLDGTVTTFRKAAPGGDKISGSWSGATLTVGQSVVGNETFTTVISTDFVTDTTVPSSPTYHITAYRRDNDAQQPTEIQSARKQYKLGVLSGSKTTVRILNAAGTSYINGTATYTIPLTTLTATSNGNYSPSGNNVGYSSVTVNVPSDMPNARVRFGGSSGQYYYEAFDSVSGTSVSGSSVTYHLGLSGTTVQIQNANNTKISGTMEYAIPLETKTVTANGTVSPSSGKVGLSSVTVNVPLKVAGSWSSNTYTATYSANGSASVSTSVGTYIGQLQGYTGYYAYTGSYTSSSQTPVLVSGTQKQLTIVDNGNNAVKLQRDGTDTGLTFTHNKYTAGQNSVYVYRSGYAAGTGTSGYITYSPYGSTGASKTARVYCTYKSGTSSSDNTEIYARFTDDEWATTNVLSSTPLYLTASGTTVSLRWDSASGTVIASKAITVNHQNPYGTTIAGYGEIKTANITADGKSTAFTLEAAQFYPSSGYKSGRCIDLKFKDSNGAANVIGRIGDANIVAGNIKKNVSIFGVTGTFAPNVYRSAYSAGTGTSGYLTYSPDDGAGTGKTVRVYTSYKSGTSSSDNTEIYARFTDDEWATTNVLASTQIYLTASGTTVSLRWDSASGTVIASKTITVNHQNPYGTSIAGYGETKTANITADGKSTAFTLETATYYPSSGYQSGRCINLKFKDSNGSANVIGRIGDSYLIAGNVKKGVSIFGVSGSFAPNVYRSAYSEGTNTSGYITYSPDAGQGSGITVRIYNSYETVSGVLYVSARFTDDNWASSRAISKVPLYLTADGNTVQLRWSSESGSVIASKTVSGGYDDNHVIGIADSNGYIVTSEYSSTQYKTISPGGSIRLWAGMKKSNGTSQWALTESTPCLVVQASSGSHSPSIETNSNWKNATSLADLADRMGISSSSLTVIYGGQLTHGRYYGIRAKCSGGTPKAYAIYA